MPSPLGLLPDAGRLQVAYSEGTSATGTEAGLDLIPVWVEVARRMGGHFAAGRRHLLTEDVLRWTTIDVLVEAGVKPSDLQVEVVIPVSQGKLDLVIANDEKQIAVEFKFPRDSRTGISPDTMTLGELLKDVYRLAAVDSFGERWAVMLLNDRLRRYLERRTDCRWRFEPDQQLAFSPDGFALLPQTASRGLGEWVAASAVATCQVSELMDGHRLLAYEVQAAG